MHVLELVRWEKGRIKKEKETGGARNQKRGGKAACLLCADNDDETKGPIQAAAISSGTRYLPRVLSADTHLLVPY